ncbi:hypothetical protein EYF80_021076 [Liparis tanakae]|uniref:Uncharacterized protein n=1 Tax=Liparis tanakae TaxID=230148 RepID=A0A4Z2HSI3_9TELE|nr:hypothetical protein EYF80_021076 [Liparis tanakae]
MGFSGESDAPPSRVNSRDLRAATCKQPSQSARMQVAAARSSTCVPPPALIAATVSRGSSAHGNESARSLPALMRPVPSRRGTKEVRLACQQIQRDLFHKSNRLSDEEEEEEEEEEEKEEEDCTQ